MNYFFLFFVFLSKCNNAKKNDGLSIVSFYNKNKFIKIKNDIKELIKLEKYSDAIEIIDEFLFNNLLIDDEYKSKLLLYKIDSLFLNDNLQESIDLCSFCLNDEDFSKKYKIQIAKRFFVFEYYSCMYNDRISEDKLIFLIKMHNSNQYKLKEFDDLNKNYVENLKINLEYLTINNLIKYKDFNDISFIIYFLSLYDANNQLIQNSKITYWLIHYLIENKFPIKFINDIVNKTSILYEENDIYYLKSLNELDKYKNQINNQIK